MPTFIPAFIAAVQAASTFLTILKVVAYGALLLYNISSTNRQKKRARAAYNASQVDRLSNVPTTIGPRELVLGRVRKGGTVIFRDSAGTNKSIMFMVVALAGHEVEGYDGFFLNDVKVTVDAGGYVQTAPFATNQTITGFGYTEPAAGTYNPGTLYQDDNGYWNWQTTSLYSYARIRTYTGTTTQTADSRLMDFFPGVWTAAHRLQGVAYAVLEFQYNETAFPNGLPNFTAIVKGKKCYDPRTGLTAYTTNPALHARELLTNYYFGRRTSMDAEEDADIIAAANACDTNHTVDGVTGPLYVSSIVVPFGSQTIDALDDVVQAMAGMWAHAGGLFTIRAGVYTAPELTLTDDDFLTSVRSTSGTSANYSVSISTHRAHVDKINQLTGKIWDADADFKEVVTDPVINSAAQTADGEVLESEVELTAVPNKSRAKLILNFMLKDSRDPLVMEASFKIKAYPLQLFDTVLVTNSRYGMTNKAFIIIDKTFSSESLVRLKLKETTPEIFNPAVFSNSTGYAKNTDLVEPWDIDPAVITSVDSGTAHLVKQQDGTILTRVKVTIAAVTDERINQAGSIEVAWKPISTTLEAWNIITLQGNETSTYILGAPDGKEIIVKARTRNAVAISDWGVQQYHTVLGKTAAPSNVTSGSASVVRQDFYLSWAEIADVDVAGYEVRTTNTGWGVNSSYVFKGDGTSTVTDPSPGTWYVKAYDTTGNYSAAAATITFTPAAIADVTGVSYVFTDTSLTAATVTLKWTDAVTPQFGLEHYSVTYTDGSSITITTKSNTLTLPANWLGDRAFVIKAVSRFGYLSTGVSVTATLSPPAPVTAFSAQVIDNNVLLRWTLPNKTSLPISHVLLKKGPVFATAEVVGEKDGTFTVLNELVAGNYTYHIEVVDTDNNVSTSVPTTAFVNQPPDFVFYSAFNTDFVEPSSVYSNAIVNNGGVGVLMPVNTTETFAAHFTSNSWTTPAQQIAANYPYYIQPGVTTGYYEEVFDCGTVIGSSNLTLAYSGAVLGGSGATANVSTTISVSIDNSSYTSLGSSSQTFANNFRYVKVRVTGASVAGSVYHLQSLSLRLDNKLKTDAGTTALVSTDTTGTPINFLAEFVDVAAITLTPQGTTALYAVYEFDDTVRTGTYSLTSNTVTVDITAHGLKVGQKVRLAPVSGSLPLGVYTVATVPTADRYTFAYTGASTSSTSISQYPNSARGYLFNNSGVRQSGTISWTVRGS